MAEHLKHIIITATNIICGDTCFITIQKVRKLEKKMSQKHRIKNVIILAGIVYINKNVFIFQIGRLNLICITTSRSAM